MVFPSSNAKTFIIKTGKMRDIPQLPRLIREVLFFTLATMDVFC